MYTNQKTNNIVSFLNCCCLFSNSNFFSYRKGHLRFRPNDFKKLGRATFKYLIYHDLDEYLFSHVSNLDNNRFSRIFYLHIPTLILYDRKNNRLNRNVFRSHRPERKINTWPTRTDQTKIVSPIHASRHLVDLLSTRSDADFVRSKTKQPIRNRKVFGSSCLERKINNDWQTTTRVTCAQHSNGLKKFFVSHLRRSTMFPESFHSQTG